MEKAERNIETLKDFVNKLEFQERVLDKQIGDINEEIRLLREKKEALEMKRFRVSVSLPYYQQKLETWTYTEPKD